MTENSRNTEEKSTFIFVIYALYFLTLVQSTYDKKISFE